MKKAAILFLSLFAVSAFSSAYACEYMNKTITMKSGDKEQISQGQSPVVKDEKLIVSTPAKAPVESAN